MPFFSLIIGFAIFVLLYFSANFFASSRDVRYLNYLLGLVLLARSGQLLVFLLIDSELIIYVPVLLKLFCPLYYTVPAFIYLYTIGFINNRTGLRKIDYLHFLPGVLAIIDDSPWYLSPSIHWDTIALELARTKNISIVTETGLLPPDLYLYIRPVMMTIYLLLAFYQLLKSELFKGKPGTQKNWILSVLSTVSVFHVVTIFKIYYQSSGAWFDGQNGMYIWVFSIGSALFLVWLWILILNPKILYGYLLVSLVEKNKFIEPKLTKNPNKKAIALKSYSNLEQIQSIHNYMLHEKPFLQSDFQIIYMANYFKIPTHQCSSMINNLIGKNFRDWVNSYRIEYFIKIYPEKSQKLKIDGIAFESGFSSMTTFYRVFKKQTGKIPLDYF